MNEEINSLLQKRALFKKKLSELLTYKGSGYYPDWYNIIDSARDFDLKSSTLEDFIMDLTYKIDDIDEDLKGLGYKIPFWESIRGRDE